MVGVAVRPYAAACDLRHRTTTADLDLETAGVAEVSEAMRSGATTSADLVAGYLARIDALDRRGPAVHAIRCLAPGRGGRRRSAGRRARGTAGYAGRCTAYRCW